MRANPAKSGQAPGALIAASLMLAPLTVGCLPRTHPLLSCPTVKAFAPWDAARSTGAKAERQPDGLFAGLIGFYQRRMRPPKLPEQGCRLRPTCSAYGRQSLDRWRVLGLVLIADRLVVREHAFMTGSYLPACALDAGGDHGLHDPVP